MTKFALTNATTFRYLDDLKNSGWSDNKTINGTLQVYLLFKDVTTPDSDGDFTVSWTNDTSVEATAKVQYMYHDVNTSETTYKHLDPPFAGNLQLTRATTSQSDANTMTMSNYTGRYVDQQIGVDTQGNPIYKPCVYSEADIAVPVGEGQSATWIKAYQLYYSHNGSTIRWYYRAGSSGQFQTVNQPGTSTPYTGNDIWVNFIYEYSSSYITPGFDSRGVGVKVNVFDYDSWLDSTGNFSDAINIENAFKFASGTEQVPNQPWNRYDNRSHARLAEIWQHQLKNYGTVENPEYYPQMVTTWSGDEIDENTELKYLLDKYDGPYKRAYCDLNGFFDDNVFKKYGYYAYGSSDFTLQPISGGGHKVYEFPGHFAQIRKKSDGRTTTNEQGNDNLRDSFVLYDSPASSVAGQRKFMPFDDKDNPSETNSDFHFGMTIETPFVQPENGISAFVGTDGEQGSPMIFHFNGDDDVFVYFDDVLMLDLGGLHQSIRGDVNFADGTVKIEQSSGTNLTLYMDNLYEEVYPGYDFAAEGSGWEPSIKVGDTQHYRYADYTSHVMRFYYFERGTSESNCEIAFNLQTMPEGAIKVEKEVEKTDSQIGYLDGDFYYKVDVATASAPDDWKSYENGTDFSGLYYEVYNANDPQTVVATREPEAGGKIHIKDGQYAFLYGFHNNDKFKVAECDPKYTAETKSGEVDLLWEVWVKFGLTQDYIKPPNKIHFSSDNTDWYGTDALVAGNDNTNVVKFKNKVNADHLFDLKIKKDESNKELSTIKVSFNGDTEAETEKPINTIPYVGNYDLLDKSGQKISTLHTNNGIIQIDDGQTIMIKNVQMGTRAFVQVLDKYRKGTFEIHQFTSDATLSPDDWLPGDMSNPYPVDDAVEYSKETLEFGARIPMVNFGTTWPERNARYGLIEFSLVNEADNLTIQKLVNGTEEESGTAYSVGTTLYSDDQGNTPVTSTQMPGTYEAWFYDGSNDPVQYEVTINDNGQVLTREKKESPESYSTPSLKSGEKIVVYGLFDKTITPVKSLRANETDYSTEWDNWSAKAKLNSLTEKSITSGESDPFVLPTLQEGETEYSLLITNTFAEPFTQYAIPFKFYQKLEDNTTEQSMDTVYAYKITSTDGGPVPGDGTFTLTGGKTTEVVTPDTLTALTTVEITEETSYEYSVSLTTTKEEPPYELDHTEFTVTATINPSAVSEKVVVTYDPKMTGHSADAGWTHKLADPEVFTIPFKFYQTLEDRTVGKTMDEAYTYKITASDGGPIPGDGTFTLSGGKTSEILTPDTLVAKTTGWITTETTYTYTVELTTTKTEPPYELDHTKFTVTATIHPDAEQETDKVIVTYNPEKTGHGAKAGWTHKLADTTVYTIPFKFYQKLEDRTTEQNMDTDYTYTISSTNNGPLPTNPTFILSGGKDSEITTPDTLTAQTKEEIFDDTTYTYSVSLQTTKSEPPYQLDHQTFTVTVTFDRDAQQVADRVIVTYSPERTGHSAKAGWTHILNPTAVDYTIPQFVFKQILINNTENEEMDQEYNYMLTATEGTPMPEGSIGQSYNFSIIGGEDERVSKTLPQIPPVSLAPVGTYNYTYIAINTDEPKERYAIDKTVMYIDVTIDTQAAVGQEVSVAYRPVNKDATWTHILNPVTPPTPTPEDISQTFDDNKGLILTLLAIVGTAGITFVIRRKRTSR